MSGWVIQKFTDRDFCYRFEHLLFAYVGGNNVDHHHHHQDAVKMYILRKVYDFCFEYKKDHFLFIFPEVSSVLLFIWHYQ